MNNSPRARIAEFIECNGVLLLDGGLATELEASGTVLDTLLWSAQLLIDDPASILAVHRRYLAAGARCLVTASYQASEVGFSGLGLSDSQINKLMHLSVELAVRARSEFCAENPYELVPLIAASIGPYGACLADGSEYRGNYGLSEKELVAFHRPRFELLANSDADLLACETIPSALEARALASLFNEVPKASGWVSFSCRDGEHANDGTHIVECARALADTPDVFAVGVNCTSPRYIPDLIAALKKELPDKEVVVYPNAGERYDGELRQWVAAGRDWDCAAEARTWRQAGASLIGGCCRVGPREINQMAEVFSD